MPLINGHYPTKHPEWALAGSPAGVYRASMSRLNAGGNLAALTTQVMLSAALYLQDGDVVSNLTFKSGGTAAVTPTNWWFALYDDSAVPALLAQSADQTTGAWAADTAKTLALSTPQLITRSGIYYAAVMVKAATVPTLIGASVQADASAGMLASDKVLAQTSGAALTTTAPATITGGTAAGTVPLAVAS